jgi:hypothetical protein
MLPDKRPQPSAGSKPTKVAGLSGAPAGAVLSAPAETI